MVKRKRRGPRGRWKKIKKILHDNKERGRREKTGRDKKNMPEI